MILNKIVELPSTERDAEHSSITISDMCCPSDILSYAVMVASCSAIVDGLIDSSFVDTAIVEVMLDGLRAV